MSALPSTSRHAIDRADGVLSYDVLPAAPRRRLRVLWLENRLECGIWSYYCELKDAMAELHELCTPSPRTACLGNGFVPDVAIAGPRFTINIPTPNETRGFARARLPELPLLIVQNKMYTPKGWREIVGSVDAKLEWARAAGAAGAFTWIHPGKSREFTRRSGVPHHWLPFAQDPSVFSRHAGSAAAASQPIDVGFTGASGLDKYPDRAAVLQTIRTLNVSAYLGTWLQMTLNRKDNQSWKALSRKGYARTVANSKLWVTTTGPAELVGTRYYEVLASGTTLLLCNAPASPHVYDGLFEDGKHVVTFRGMADLRAKILYYLAHEGARRRIVRAAHALARSQHTWNARARFISHVAESVLGERRDGRQPYYTPPPEASLMEASTKYLGCYDAPGSAGQQLRASGLREPARSRNRRRLWRYTVQLCQEACRGAAFGLSEGGFSSGNAHTQARCLCAIGRGGGGAAVDARLTRRVKDADCATACSLHDARPCGGAAALAMFEPIR